MSTHFHFGIQARGKLFRTTGIVPSVDPHSAWVGVHGYQPSTSDAVVAFLDERGEFVVFDPNVHVVTDGSYPNGVSEDRC